jgi:hypothetical protein
MSASKDNMSSTHHRAYALKTIQRVPSACNWSTLAKHGAYWPCHSEQRLFPNTERARPRSMAPQLRGVALMVRDPRSQPWGLHK